jgi:hypothetical protein
VADEEGFPGGIDDLRSRGVEVIEGLDAAHLGEQSVHEAEVAAGDSYDGCDRGYVGEVVLFVGFAGYALGEDGSEFFGAGGTVFVGESYAAV